MAVPMNTGIWLTLESARPFYMTIVVLVAGETDV